MRILIFHGYLLEGTGSNVYNARLAAALVELGHEVHLLCQERHPERQPYVDAAGDWDAGKLCVRSLRAGTGAEGSAGAGAGTGGGIPAGARCTVYRPAIGGLLPVYVADRYEGVEARTFARCSPAEIERYLDANVAAVREIAARVKPEIALANHLVMGPAILARALTDETPYAVKVHGSALEYTVKPEPERFLPYAREGLARARAVLVGSGHTARSLWAALGGPGLAARTRLGPPGVDVGRFRPLPPEQVRGAPERAATALAARLRAAAGAEAGASDERASATATPASAFARDELAAAAALERFAALAAAAPEPLRPVAFVGKLIVSKGVDLLLAAWPLVLERVPQATLLVVGFGAYRAALERLLAALADGRLEEAEAIARAGRALERDAGSDTTLPSRDAPSSSPAAPLPARDAAPADTQPLRHLLAFLQSLEGAARERYLHAAARLPERVILTGRLDHEELAELLPACEALVVPSTFPEAFGMVAAEAAACGALPVSAAHSGLAEVSEALAGALPAQAARLLSFAVDDDAIAALAQRVADWLEADPALRERTRAGLVETVRERWSWEGVARGVIAAAEGRLQDLGSVEETARAVG